MKPENPSRSAEVEKAFHAMRYNRFTPSFEGFEEFRMVTELERIRKMAKKAIKELRKQNSKEWKVADILCEEIPEASERAWQLFRNWKRSPVGKGDAAKTPINVGTYPSNSFLKDDQV